MEPPHLHECFTSEPEPDEPGYEHYVFCMGYAMAVMRFLVDDPTQLSIEMKLQLQESADEAYAFWKTTQRAHKQGPPPRGSYS